MKTKLIALCCLTTLMCSAQTTDKKFMVKLYSGYQFTQSTESTYDALSNSNLHQSNSTQNIMPFSPSFSWINNKGNYHEIELTNLMWRRERTETQYEKVGYYTSTIAGSNIYSNLYGLKYKYTQHLFTAKTWKLKPSVGYGALLQASYDAVVPLAANAFVTEETHVDGYFQVEPGFECAVYKNINFHFSVPLPLASVDFEQESVHNPAIAPNLQSNGNLAFNFFPKFYQLKLALGYKF